MKASGRARHIDLSYNAEYTCSSGEESIKAEIKYVARNRNNIKIKKNKFLLFPSFVFSFLINK